MGEREGKKGGMKETQEVCSERKETADGKQWQQPGFPCGVWV